MKLQKYLLNDLDFEDRDRLVNALNVQMTGEESGEFDGLREFIGPTDAEIVADDDDNIYDVRLFDPYNRIDAVNPYRYGDGWSNWLFEYTDNQGNNIDAIFEKYNGETQD